jgi:hypothetical protein
MNPAVVEDGFAIVPEVPVSYFGLKALEDSHFMSHDFTRRDLLKSSGVILGTGLFAPHLSSRMSPNPCRQRRRNHWYDFL